MLTGRDFARFGGRFDVHTRIGDGQGHPIDGPVHVRWIGREFMACISPNKDISLLNMNGYIPVKLCNSIAAEEAKKRAAESGEAIGEDKKDEAEHHYDYWFEEPVYMLTMEEKEVANLARAELERQKKEAPPPTRRVHLRIEASDICRVPALPANDAMRIGISDLFNGSVKVLERSIIPGKQDSWSEVDTVGSRYIEVASTGARNPGLLDKPTGIDCVKLDRALIYFVCDAAKNAVLLLSTKGDVLWAIEAEGPSIDMWRQPVSISCVVIRPNRVVDMILWEKEQQKLRQQEIDAAIEAESIRLQEEEAEKRMNAAQLRKLKEKKEDKHVGLGKVAKEAPKVLIPAPSESKDAPAPSPTKESPTKAKQAKSKTNTAPSADGYEHPSWYLGFADEDDLRTYLYSHKDAGKPGDFAVGRRVDSPYIFDLLYIADDANAKNKKAAKGGFDEDERSKGKGSIIKLTLKKQLADKNRDVEGGILLQTAIKGAGQKDKLFSCIWAFIRTQKQLRSPIFEPRPYVLCAIADKGNFRVQIYKYFWTENDIFAPSFEYSHTVGGIRRVSLELISPSLVSFSPTGELVILDTGTQPYATLYLLSQRGDLIKVLDMPFKKNEKTRKKNLASGSGDISGGEKPVIEQWPYWRQAKVQKFDRDGVLIEEGEGGGGSDDANPFGADAEAQRKIALSKKQVVTETEKHGRFMKGESYLKKMEEIKKAQRKKEDKIATDGMFVPTSASFSPDGALAVGYKNGGVLLYRQYKSYAVGNFSLIPLSCMNGVISFADYASVVLLRNCCRFLHNHTKRLRACWGINPMRRELFDSVLYHFLRWAVNSNDDRVYYGTSQKVVSVDTSPPVSVSVSAVPGSSGSAATGHSQHAKAIVAIDAVAGAKDVISTHTHHSRDSSSSSSKGTPSSRSHSHGAEKDTSAGREGDQTDSKEREKESASKAPPAKSPPPTFTDTSHCYPYCDREGNLLCEKYIQRCCTTAHCPFKHGPLQSIGDSRHYPTVNIAGIELVHLKLACYVVFSSRFVWAKERYIEELFAFYSVPVEKDTRREVCHRNGTMKKREILRDVRRQMVPLLSMSSYLDIMQALEEDFRKARRIQKHALFYRHSRFAPASIAGAFEDDLGSITTAASFVPAKDKESTRELLPDIRNTSKGDKSSAAGSRSAAGSVSGSIGGGSAAIEGLPEAEAEPEAEVEQEEFKPYGPYDIDATHKRIYVDVLEQYDMTQVKNGINVPYLPLHPGNKKFLTLKGLDNETRGVGDTEVDKYSHTFESQTSKAVSMMGRLFL